MESGLSASDVALINDRNGYNNGNMWGDNGLMWIFALLTLPAMWGGGGFGFGNRGGEQPVTEAGLCNAMNFNNLQNDVGRLGDQQVQLAMQEQRDLCTSTTALASQLSSNAAQTAQCCCETNRNIDAVRYENAQNTAAINANTTAQVQKILDAICGNRMADMQNQINQLQLQSALCGVVRYPNSIAYSAGASPFCNGGSCSGYNI